MCAWRGLQTYMFSVCYKQNKTFLIVSREATDSSRPDVFISDPVRFFFFLARRDFSRARTRNGRFTEYKDKCGGKGKGEEGVKATPSMVCCDCDSMAWRMLMIDISKWPYFLPSFMQRTIFSHGSPFQRR